MARAYQEAHVLDNLSESFKILQLQTAELQKSKGLHDEKITNLQKQNAEQAKKIEALEIRMSAKYASPSFPQRISIQLIFSKPSCSPISLPIPSKLTYILLLPANTTPQPESKTPTPTTPAPSTRPSPPSTTSPPTVPSANSQNTSATSKPWLQAKSFKSSKPSTLKVWG